jgi:hypothetical protein
MRFPARDRNRDVRIRVRVSRRNKPFAKEQPVNRDDALEFVITNGLMIIKPEDAMRLRWVCVSLSRALPRPRGVPAAVASENISRDEFRNFLVNAFTQGSLSVADASKYAAHCGFLDLCKTLRMIVAGDVNGEDYRAFHRLVIAYAARVGHLPIMESWNGSSPSTARLCAVHDLRPQIPVA